MKILKTAVLTGLLLASAAANASTGYSGYITLVHSMPGGRVLFTQSGARSTQPGCATIAGRWAFDGTTTAGQGRLATLLTVYALHKPIWVGGTDACTIWGDTEDVSLLRTDDQ